MDPAETLRGAEDTPHPPFLPSWEEQDVPRRCQLQCRRDQAQMQRTKPATHFGSRWTWRGVVGRLLLRLYHGVPVL